LVIHLSRILMFFTNDNVCIELINFKAPEKCVIEIKQKNLNEDCFEYSIGNKVQSIPSLLSVNDSLTVGDKEWFIKKIKCTNFSIIKEEEISEIVYKNDDSECYVFENGDMYADNKMFEIPIKESLLTALTFMGGGKNSWFYTYYLTKNQNIIIG
jgi:hypothetical protein